jgi:predicted P-loop ATPase
VRLAYERTAREIPRRCIIIGTTNDSAYLSDATGNRRFLPVETNAIDLTGLARDRDQLLVEALEIWRANPTVAALELPKNIWGEAAEEQEQRRHIDPWEEAVDPLLVTAAEGEGWLGTIELISKLSYKTPAELKTQDYQRFNRVMQTRKQWKATRMMVKGVQARGYILRGGALWKKWSNRLGV